MRAIPRPTLRIDSGSCPRDPTAVRVSDLTPELLASLNEAARSGGSLKSIFRVSVSQTRSGSEVVADLPDVAGRYQVLEDGLRFIPHFPFARGVEYRASFDLHLLSGQPSTEVLTLEFSFPREQSIGSTKVEQVFPSSNTLPENLLRFYVRFSDAMQRGRAGEQITLLDSCGKPATDVLYRAPVELWDRSMRHLTVLLDPGRLKRGVGPHVELGQPLELGQEYTLSIGAGLLDHFGRPLREAFSKRFRVSEAVRRPVPVERWEVVPPLAGSRRPLMILFSTPLDWAMLWQAISIESADGSPIDGQIAIDHEETRWSFSPTLPWANGNYRVRIAPDLEDVCGNNVTAAFDGPFQTGSHLARQTADRLLTFDLKAGVSQNAP